MELELALSLSSSASSSSSCFSHFDLNNYSHGNVEAKEVFECFKMEPLKKMKKPCINSDAYNGFHVPQTLPLLFCNKSNQEHDVNDDAINDVESTFIFINHKTKGEENGVVGWPPVKSSRKTLCHRGGWGGGSKSTYVKVQMEGDGIARKINLNLHHSYNTLVHALAQMFGKCNEDVKLTYQDKEGDWLLAGDVPWGSFVENVKRLKLVKKT
ncbi:putative transcription factor interactor and regulator AUX-IAA family [Helianthus annuus]|nr:putative transcription factor interactor and regulator AUX-IAA family [Helianthus annuus]